MDEKIVKNLLISFGEKVTKLCANSDLGVSQVSKFLLTCLYPLIVPNYEVDHSNTEALINALPQLLDVCSTYASKPSQFFTALSLLMSISSLLIIIHIHLSEKGGKSFDNECKESSEKIMNINKNILQNITKLQQSELVSVNLLLLYSSRIDVSITGLPDPNEVSKALSIVKQVGVGIVKSLLTQSLDKSVLTGLLSGKIYIYIYIMIIIIFFKLKL